MVNCRGACVCCSKLAFATQEKDCVVQADSSLLMSAEFTLVVKQTRLGTIKEQTGENDRRVLQECYNNTWYLTECATPSYSHLKGSIILKRAYD